MTAQTLVKHRKPELFEGDLSEERLQHYLSKPVIAVDTETRGLILRRDRLCLVQICDHDGVVSFVRYKGDSFDAAAKSNVKTLLEAPGVLKIFHFGRFDISVLKYYLGAQTNPVFCTKIASKLVRTYTDRHGLKDLVKELLRIELDKSDQTSDWSAPDLSDSQLEYAANDVRVLLPIYDRITALLEREGRMELAQKLFQALPTICELDINGFKDMFEH
ncbi:MAG: ribonuclease H-like domain-containing protein [Cyanobacteria bacterium REEB67]|nr:ribonuclease H-like domain-containing protein [Cyanobacteria bacterium REEB67]